MRAKRPWSSRSRREAYTAIVENTDGTPGVGIVEVLPRQLTAPHAMAKPTPAPDVQSLVLTVRGQRVMIDADLAIIYAVPFKPIQRSGQTQRGSLSQ